MIDGAGTLLILDPDHPNRPLYPVQHLGLIPLLMQAAAQGTGAWVSGFEGEVVELAFDGRPKRRRRCPEAAVPVPASSPLRLLSRTARYLVDSATGQLHETARWLPVLKLKTERPCLTDSTLEWLSDQGLVRIRHWQQPVPAVAVQPWQPDGQAPNSIAYVLEYDALGTRWAFSRYWRGCYKQRPVPRVVQSLRRAGPGLPPLESARAIVRLPDGRLLASTYDSVWVQPAGQPAAPLQKLIKQSTGQQLGNLFNAIQVLPDGTVLVAVAFRGFHRLDPATGEIHPLPVAAGPVPGRYVSLFRDHAGRVWGGDETGFFQLDLRRQCALRYAANDAHFPLHNLFINEIAED